MPADLLLVSEVAVQDGQVDRAAKAWAAGREPSEHVRLYRALEGSALLELRALSGLAELDALRARWAEQWQDLAPLLAGDIRRQAHTYVETPKGPDAVLPPTPYVQLRRVEVKPPVLDDYRAWRDRTIFETVRTNEAVELLSAYHSLLTGEPGVLFLSGFSDPAAHDAVFGSPAYQEILVQARENYIIPQGGERGLFTRTYALLES
jgi:hypothetical protein